MGQLGGALDTDPEERFVVTMAVSFQDVPVNKSGAGVTGLVMGLGVATRVMSIWGL